MRTPRPLRVTIFPDPGTLAQSLATTVAGRIAASSRIVLGLPTGRTPIPFYQALSRQPGMDFSHVTTFNLDEFVGLAPDHPDSYRSFMRQQLFDHVNIPPEQVHFLNGVAPDPIEECARYEGAIVDAGGIDLQILGLGMNGHIGFNEPAPALEARTHRVTLTEETRRANAASFGGDPAAVPAEALSMGMATILHARTIVLLATGAAKAAIVERLVHGPITPELPASFLQLHHDVEIMLDEASARELSRHA